MFVGFDYGTSNCAMAQVRQGQATLIPLYGSEPLVPSTVYALDRALISHFVSQHLQDSAKPEFGQSRRLQLHSARQLQQELGSQTESLFFGQEAIEQHIAGPTEGYFIKSPKSFLGASGLRQPWVEFFEDVVAAMMLNIKQRAELSTNQLIDQAVIGRPVNFQGINAQTSNAQAISILTTAGHRAGFRDIEFLYEPLAAGFDFETRLPRNQKVLVVDIGGGTTDCSMVLMGPDHIHRLDRQHDFLGHTGERIGGNDFDIQFALNVLMPEFGLNSLLKNGLPMPRMPFVQGTAINDVSAQTEFYGTQAGILYKGLATDTTEPAKFRRFMTMREGKHNYAVVRTAEHCKVALSSKAQSSAPLNFIDRDLAPLCTSQQLAEATEGLVTKIQFLVNEAIRQAGGLPEVVYLTGGSSKSPLIRQGLKQLLGEAIVLIDGDHFGSVVAGLGIWAERIFGTK